MTLIKNMGRHKPRLQVFACRHRDHRVGGVRTISALQTNYTTNQQHGGGASEVGVSTIVILSPAREESRQAWSFTPEHDPIPMLPQLTTTEEEHVVSHRRADGAGPELGHPKCAQKLEAKGQEQIRWSQVSSSTWQSSHTELSRTFLRCKLLLH
jgi:hypothetical protein